MYICAITNPNLIMSSFKHKDVKQLLINSPGQRFVNRLLADLYRKGDIGKGSDFFHDIAYNYKLVDELTIRKEHESLRNWDGSPSMNSFRFDAVLLVRPSHKFSLSRKTCFTVGIEIKVDPKDLEQDKKIHEYLHYTDYFALAVMPDMLDDATDKIERIEHAHPEVKGKIGLISCDMVAPDVSMIRPMKRIDVPLEHAIEVRDAVIFGVVFDSQRIGIYLKDPSAGRPTEFNSPEYPRGDSGEGSVNEHPQGEGQISDQGEMMDGPNQQDYTQDKPMKSDSELARERERRERAAAQREELQAKMRAELSEKFEVLPKILAERLNTLPLSDQQVWSLINDTPGINANQIVDYFQSVSDERYRKSKATVSRAVDALKQAGLVEFRGARKNGGYHVPEDVLSCSSESCAMCGRATLCDSFLPADTIS